MKETLITVLLDSCPTASNTSVAQIATGTTPTCIDALFVCKDQFENDMDWDNTAADKTYQLEGSGALEGLFKTGNAPTAEFLHSDTKTGVLKFTAGAGAITPVKDETYKKTLPNGQTSKTPSSESQQCLCSQHLQDYSKQKCHYQPGDIGYPCLCSLAKEKQAKKQYSRTRHP
jgi:hypothetical protein